MLWNLLCQYNNIYVNSYKHLKERGKKKKKSIVATVATIPVEQTKEVLFAH